MHGTSTGDEYQRNPVAVLQLTPYKHQYLHLLLQLIQVMMDTYTVSYLSWVDGPYIDQKSKSSCRGRSKFEQYVMSSLMKIGGFIFRVKPKLKKGDSSYNEPAKIRIGLSTKI